MEISSFRYNSGKPLRKGSFLKRLLVAGLALVILLSAGGYAYIAVTKPLPPLSTSLNLLAPVAGEAVNLPWPSAGQAAIGSLEEGVLARSSEAETPRPTASIAKIITALSVMKQNPFEIGSQGATITLDGVDAGYYDSYIAKGGSAIPISTGEQLTQYQALQALLLPSANNIADSLARWGFGSLENYNNYANAMLKEMGLSQTVVADASGFSPDTVSTPSELIALGQEILSDPVLAQIVAEKEAVIPVAGTIRNTNQLLSNSQVTGLKTGHTNEAGNCLLFSAKHAIDSDHSVTVIGVITGGTSMASVSSAASALLEAAYAGFGSREAVVAGTVIGTYEASWGTKTDIETQSSLVYYGWKGLELHPEAVVRPEKAPLSKGRVVGAVKFKNLSSGDSALAATSGLLPQPNTLWRLQHYF